MKTAAKTNSAALKFLTLCWEAIPRRSWRNRNAAMYSALKNAVASGMHFDPEDMLLVQKRFNAGYWTSDGEQIYSMACATGNIPAAIAIEKWLGRPAVLWAEKIKTPERLCVGAKFTWDGLLVTVTSMGEDKLVACTYKDQKESVTPQVGEVIWYGRGYRRIEAFTAMDDGRVAMRLAPKPVPSDEAGRDRSTIERRISITYTKLSEQRKAYDATRKEYLAALAATATLDDLAPINARVVAAGRRAFRHFDIEAINDAYKAAATRIKEGMSADKRAAQQRKEAAFQAAELLRWMAGEDVFSHFDVVRLRVKGDIVETSTMQSATVAGVRRALAFIEKHRAKGWSNNGESFDLDQFPLRSIEKMGVQVGCTFVEWSEVDRIAALLK